MTCNCKPNNCGSIFRGCGKCKDEQNSEQNSEQKDESIEVPTILVAVASTEVKEMVNEDMGLEDPKNDEQQNEQQD
jgi:hypothetical protein